MGTQYVINSETMEKIADPLRSLAGRTDDLKPAEMEAAGNAAVSEVDDQTALLAQLEAVLTEKATASGGIDLDSIRIAWVYGGISSFYYTHIAFAEGMTWAEFINSPLNAGAADQAGPSGPYDTLLRAYNGRVCLNISATPLAYLVRNGTEDPWQYGKAPKSNDTVIAPDDLIVANEYYWFRASHDWNP